MAGKNRVAIVLGLLHYGYPLRDQSIETSSDENLLYTDRDRVSLVLFTGGEDVHPYLYGGVDCGVSISNFERDKYELNIFRYCVKHNIKMAGVCRGFQFLNVMAGGKMWQHLNGHGGFDHFAYFGKDRLHLLVTSTHHQLVDLDTDSVPIAWANPKKSKLYVSYDAKVLEGVDGPKWEIESAVFPTINSVGVQYHPEMMEFESPCRRHFGLMIKDFLNMPMNDFVSYYGRNPDECQPRTQGQGA